MTYETRKRTAEVDGIIKETVGFYSQVGIVTSETLERDGRTVHLQYTLGERKPTSSGGAYFVRKQRLTLTGDMLDLPDDAIKHIVQHVILKVLGL